MKKIIGSKFKHYTGQNYTDISELIQLGSALKIELEKQNAIKNSSSYYTGFAETLRYDQFPERHLKFNNCLNNILGFLETEKKKICKNNDVFNKAQTEKVFGFVSLLLDDGEIFDSFYVDFNKQVDFFLREVLKTFVDRNNTEVVSKINLYRIIEKSFMRDKPKNKWTLLAQVTRSELPMVMKFLLENGADPNIKVKEQITQYEDQLELDDKKRFEETEYPLSIAIQFSTADEVMGMVNLLLNYKSNLSEKSCNRLDYEFGLQKKLLWKRDLDYSYSKELYDEIIKILFIKANPEIDNNTYEVPGYKDYTKQQFFEDFKKIEGVCDSTSLVEVENEFKRWIDSLISKGVSDNDIQQIWSRGPCFVKFLLTKYTTFPENRESTNDEVLYLFNIDYLSHGFMMRNTLKESPNLRFYPEPDTSYKSLLQYLNNGDVLFPDQTKMKWTPFNYNVGNFLGFTENGEAQGFIANVLWFSIFCKKNHITPREISLKLKEKLPNLKKSITSYRSSQAFPLPGIKSWNRDIVLLDDKNKPIFCLYDGIFDMLENYGFIQSPDGSDKQRNLYHLPLQWIIKNLLSPTDKELVS